MTDPTQAAARLTATERKVVRLISLGCTVKEVATILRRSVHTVDNHKTRAMKKLNVHNAAALTRRAIRDGVSPLDDALTPNESARRIGQTLPPTTDDVPVPPSAMRVLPTSTGGAWSPVSAHC